MGWSKGKGLGANLDGSLNFIKVSHKDNQKGMGFKDRDDQWTQHEDNFNALLKSFESANNGGGSDGKDDGEDSSGESSGRIGFGFKSAEPKPTKESVFSGVSLEEQSKKSRSRVHYKKFTRGKDMARYSEQDLANIFGKRSLSDKHTQVIEAEEETPSKDQPKEDDSSTEEKTFGVTVIKTGLSVTDYFKAKMEAMRANRKGPDGAKSSNPFYVYQPEKVTLDFSNVEESNEVETQNDISSEKVSTKKRKRDAVIQEEEEPSHQSEEHLKKVKKSKKKSKQSVEDAPIVESTLETSADILTPEPDVSEMKKSKKKKSKQSEDEVQLEDTVPEQDKPEKKKSKKKSKNIEKEVPLAESSVQVPELDVAEKKKSKKKSKHVDKEVLVEIAQESSNADLIAQEQENQTKRKNTDDEDASTSIAVPTKKSKKSKKNKHHDDVENQPILIVDDESPEASPSANKKAKREVIKTQPLHFPKFVSHILTSLYDPNIAEVGQSELDATQTSSATTSAPATSSLLSTTSTEPSLSPTTNILEETFELAKYKAEVFRFFDLGGFPGSTLGDIVGYGYSRNLQLKVTTHQRDDARITNFWDLALVNKYGADAIQIKKVAKKKKYNIKTLEKKNVFKF